MVGQPPSSSQQSNNSHNHQQPVSSTSIMPKSSSSVNNSSPQQQSASNNNSAAAASSLKCLWCRETKRQLNYVLPTQHGKKEFCSELCLLEFRRAYNKGTCTTCSTCECVIRLQQQPQPRIKLQHNGKEQEFCSQPCSQEYKQKHNLNKPATPPLPPATKKKQYDPTKTFKWPEYLSLTNSRPAPAHCFKQSLTPPGNEFATDMKLEAIDPRNTTSTCIATVIGSVGPRIRLRLDGSDNANDFWRMVDSSDEIQPIGTCEKSGGLLQPPLGFRMNASFWTTFLHKTLNGAQMAPDKCFKKEPVTPRFNLFKVGYKLEAVDRKNPHLICVATVGGVDRDNIHVTFDGWRGAFDYWCKYDSRDIFPVGWCELANHPLQQPGNKVPLYQTTATPPQQIPPLQSNQQPPHHQQISSTHHHENSTVPQQQPTSTAPFITLHLHPSCNCGPYLDPTKLKTSPTIIGPSNIQDVYNQFISILKSCSTLKGPAVDSLLYGNEQLLLHEQGDFWNEVIGINERFGFCTNFVGDKSFDLVLGSSKVLRDCGKCGGGKGRSNGDAVGRVKRKSSGSSVKKEVVDDDVPVVMEKKLKVVEKVVVVEEGQQGGSVDPNDWDVECVIKSITGIDGSMEMYADLFRKHEIDGKAMLLLNSDMMMRYMGLKLGPALKICNIINKLKSKNNLKNGSSNGT